MKFLEENKELFSAYSFAFKNNPLVLKYLKIIEGEFYNYYGVHSRINSIKFFYFFLKNKFIYRNVIFENSKDLNHKKIVFINTVDYLFNDNLVPLVEALNSRGIKSGLIKYDTSSLFFSFNFKFLKFYFCKEVWFNLHNLVITIYIQQFIIPRVIFLLKKLDGYKFENKLFISADPADLLSRCAYFISKECDSKFFLLQSGPITEETIEWSSICCDLISCWKRDKEFFDNLGFYNIPFFPPRFYYINDTEMNPFMDVVIVLPWLHDDVKKEMSNLIYNIILFLNKTLIIKPYIKFHPAGKINLDFDSDLYETILESDIKKVLPYTKRILHFGSTVYFDCFFLNIKCGLLNFNNLLNVNFFHSDNLVTFEINSFSALYDFLKLEIHPFEKPLIEKDFVDYIISHGHNG